MKKVKCFSLIIVLSCIFILSGCANIEYQRLVDDFGQILDKITIEVDSTKLPDSVNVDHLMQNIESDIIKYYLYPMNQILVEFEQKYPTEYHELRQQFSVSEIIKSNKDGIYKLSVEIVFANSDVMALMYGYDTSEDDGDESSLVETKSFFIKKYEQTSDNVFGDITLLQFNGTNLYDKYREYVGEEFDASDITLTQIYGTTDTRMHTNADQTLDFGGFTCHLWEFNGADSSGVLKFYYLSPNTTGWYVLALIITFVSVICMVTIFLARKACKKYKTKIDITTQLDEEDK